MGRQLGHAKSRFMLGRQPGQPRSQPFQDSFLAGPAAKKRQRLRVVRDGRELGVFGRREKRRHDPLCLDDLLDSLEVNTQLMPRQTPIRASSEECDKLNRSAARPSPVSMSIAPKSSTGLPWPTTRNRMAAADRPKRPPRISRNAARQRANRRRSRARTNRAARARSSSESTSNSGPGSAVSTSSVANPESRSTSQTRTSAGFSAESSVPGRHSQSEGHP